ncbi:MAG: NUDIX hydrolase [Candidatus Cyclobacteriaceae bacterium M3_2C_046]
MNEKLSRKKLQNLSVDCCIFGFSQKQFKILLIQRSNAFMTSQWALPGDNIYVDESAEQAAIRILQEMSGVRDIYLDQVGAFSQVQRIKDQRIVTIGFLALVDINKHRLQPHISEAEAADWFDIEAIPNLPLDHKNILDISLFKLKRRFRFEPLGFELLPTKFSLRQLQDLYESLYDIKLDNRNFRKKILKPGHLIPLNEKQENVSHRRATLYRFDQEIYSQLKQKGVNMDVLPGNFVH